MAEPLEGLIERLEEMAGEDAMILCRPWPEIKALATRSAQALRLLGDVEKALEEIKALDWGLIGVGTIARSTLDKLRKGMGTAREPSPTTCAAPLASKLADQQRGASGAEGGD